MKKILLSILTMATLSASAQFVNIPDANFKAYLVGNTAINTGGDPNEIEVSEASAFTGTINCVSSSISDLTGIEAFTGLTDLNCALNTLSSIDISNNTSLTNFNCYSNSLSVLNVSSNTSLISLSCGLNSLTSLNVSNNTSLSYFWCESNSLNSLDVSNNTSLIYLICPSNILSSLDVSNNTSLTELQCQSNSLSSLNVSNGNNLNFIGFDASQNPSLSCIQVDNIAYSTTNWTNIDATASFSTNCGSPCTVNIPDANFKAYLVGNTAINTGGDPNEIECSEASAFTGTINCNSLSISDLTGIENFTSLTELRFMSNQVTSIDLTQNIALVTLDCSGNPLSNLNVIQNIALMILGCQSTQLSNLNVSHNTNLIHLGCDDNQLTSLDVSNNTALTTLWCQQNSLTALDVSNNTALTSLGCYFNSLTTLDVANGNNINFTWFNATNNPNLSCIQVDNVAYSTTNWTNVDATASFSTNCGTVGINETAQNLNLTTYPNPTTGNVTFTTSEQINRIEVYNLTGQKVATFNNTNTIDISSLPKGMYTAKVTSNNKIGVAKLIKE